MLEIMTKYEIIPTITAHIEELAQTMCSEDIDECWAARHYTPLEALEQAVKISNDATTGLIDGVVACIFGVAPVSVAGGKGSPWMLTAPVLRKHGKTFLRGTRMWMEDQKYKWLSLENYVDARHTLAIRWLKWTGFDMDKPAPYGPDGMSFHKFHWESA